MTNSVPTPSRAALVDFSHPIVYAAVSYLIPSSYQWNNIFSATKPFQTWVTTCTQIKLPKLLISKRKKNYYYQKVIFSLLVNLIF